MRQVHGPMADRGQGSPPQRGQYPGGDLHGARSPLKIVGDLRVAKRTFVDSATLRGTWPGGPAVEDIKRRVVLDEATREVLADEVFVCYDPTFSWLGALPEGSRRAGEPRTIEVTLWYEDVRFGWTLISRGWTPSTACRDCRGRLARGCRPHAMGLNRWRRRKRRGCVGRFRGLKQC